MATLRNEFLAVVARVGLRLAAAFNDVEGGDLSLRGVELVPLGGSSPVCARYGLDVKKDRFRGRLVAVVRWNCRSNGRRVGVIPLCI